MKRSFSSFFRAAFCAQLIFFCLAAFAQDKSSHNMHDMPGMDMSQPRDKKKEEKSPPQHSRDAAMQTTPTQSPTPKSSATPAPSPTPASHAHHGMNGMMHESDMNDSEKMSHGEGSLMTMNADGEMGIRIGASETNLLPMGQMGSGTSWQPASSPSWMLHKTFGAWLVMLHGEAKLGVNHQGGARGATKFESANWLMPMAFHKLGKGAIELRGMFSLEPLTFARGGTPELFQTGETYKGQPLIDKQHPHDLFMELSATYALPVGERGSFFTYFGFPGEPALGPVAFMHRASASENSSAPLAHHLQDSTHISFGVFTTGFAYKKFKIEGALFNGREPDENRYNFEFHPFDSRSARLSYAPTENWTTQISYGYLKNPERLEPGVTRRATASIQYNKPFARGNWASALIWGRNDIHSDDGRVFHLNGYTAESTLNFLDKNYAYTRLELVDRNELLSTADRIKLGIKDEHPSFRIGAYTFGYVRDVWQSGKLLVGVGGDTTFYSMPPILDQIYGGNPVSYKFFIRIRPRRMTMEDMRGGHMHEGQEMSGDAGHAQHHHE